MKSEEWFQRLEKQGVSGNRKLWQKYKGVFLRMVGQAAS